MSQAQLLQCPDCGHRHDLATLGDAHTFRCDKCGRALKVPAQYRNGAEAGAAAPASAPKPTATPAPPRADATVRQPAVSEIPQPRPVATTAAASTAAAPATKTMNVWRRDPGKVRVPFYWRLLIWIAAIPIGLLVVFQLIARKLGWLTQNELIDAFTAGGWDRFRPIAQLLPLAAFVIALIVQGSVYGLERWYRHRASARTAAADGPQDAGAVRATGS
ncbi:MAG TPA: hypothetical protein VGO03_13365 [Acidimicrobiia bacterium]